jgi:C4-dicarboxylate-specific signal transduction histidine kinase
LKKSVLEHYIIEAKDESDLIERNIVRAGNLVRSFKQVAVDQTSECRRQFDLKQIVDQVTTTMRPVLDKNVHRLVVDIDEGILIDGFPGSVEQVITSFINNALFHAFDGIRTGVMTLSGRGGSDHVYLEFSDNGAGMSENVAAHAFDPFFSTRMGAGGSGLGLYIVNNIVTGILGGTIELITSEGNGTQFKLILPLVSPEPILESSDVLQ